MEKKIKTILVSPIASCVDTMDWIGTEAAPSAFRFINSDNPDFKCALSVVNSEYMRYSYFDFLNLFSKHEPLFGNLANSPSHYLGVEHSYKILRRLLVYQMGESEVPEFMNTLVNVIDRRVPKLNCIHVQSPPSAGKNFFFDAVKDFFLSSGEVGTINKTNAFPFNSAIGKRIILFNEPNFEDRAVEDLKKLLGGDSMNAKAKHVNDKVIFRTPILMLSNQNVFAEHQEVWRDRVRRYFWEYCPPLKTVPLKPNPLSLIYLIAEFCTLMEYKSASKAFLANRYIGKGTYEKMKNKLSFI